MLEENLAKALQLGPGEEGPHLHLLGPGSESLTRKQVEEAYRLARIWYLPATEMQVQILNEWVVHPVYGPGAIPGVFRYFVPYLTRQHLEELGFRPDLEGEEGVESEGLDPALVSAILDDCLPPGPPLPTPLPSSSHPSVPHCGDWSISGACGAAHPAGQSAAVPPLPAVAPGLASPQPSASGQTLSIELFSSAFQNLYGLLLIWSSLQPLQPQVVQLAFDFILLYMYVDHYADNPHIPPAEKKATLAALVRLVHTPWAEEPPPGMVGAVEAFRRLLAQVPQAQPALIHLFQSELTIAALQKGTPNLAIPRESHLHLCELKGGRTALAGYALLPDLGPDLYQDFYRIGSCVQLLDDLNDVDRDLEADITTIAVYDVRTYQSLDQLWLYTLRRIATISGRFNLVKILLYGLVFYVLDASPYTSRRLKLQFRPLTYIRHSLGTDLIPLVEGWLRHQLSAKILSAAA